MLDERLALTSQEIIQKQLDGNKSYELRTAYSQTKIMKRKESKLVAAADPANAQTSALLHAAAT